MLLHRFVCPFKDHITFVSIALVIVSAFFVICNVLVDFRSFFSIVMYIFICYNFLATASFHRIVHPILSVKAKDSALIQWFLALTDRITLSEEILKSLHRLKLWDYDLSSG